MTVDNMYLLTEWEGRTGKYLARGQDVRTERSEVRASCAFAFTHFQGNTF